MTVEGCGDHSALRRVLCASLRAGIVLLAAAMPAAAGDIDRTRLPLGDGKISDGPKPGWIWACHVVPGGGGAHRTGPWIDANAGTWDATGKTSVQGSVTWPHRFRVSLDGNRRLIVSENLPNHPTGRFPIAPSDPAFQYDRNPNSIRSHDVRIELPQMPTPAATPSCAPPAVGVLLSGALLFNALDLPGRDAVAHETQDLCQGHPQQTGFYHYHSLTSCMRDERDARGHSTLVGYALDGFGIFGPYGERGEALTSADLDGCHGHVHPIPWDGKSMTLFHYHATPDFPYTVGCLRGRFDRAILRSVLGPPPGRRPPGR